MSITSKPLRELTAVDIDELFRDQVAEGSQVEFKSRLTNKKGTGSATVDGIPDQVRNKIAAEIVAFANTYGGTVVVGIEETEDEPPRAAKKVPIANCADVARRLRQSVQSIIDPPLLDLAAEGIVTEPDGHSGVIALRVQQSPRAPHRQNSNKEIYIRRQDESVKIDMREAQSLTLNAYSETKRIEEELASRRGNLISYVGQKEFAIDRSGVVPSLACGFQLIGMPLTPLHLGSVADRPELHFPQVKLEVDVGELFVEAAWPSYGQLSWRPALGKVWARYSNDTRNAEAVYTVTKTGLCEMSFVTARHGSHPDLYAGWLVGAMVRTLFWIDRVRTAAGIPEMEFVLAPLIVLTGSHSGTLARYGTGSFGYDVEDVPVGSHTFENMAVTTVDNFPALLASFDEELWHMCGKNYPKSAEHFRIGKVS